MPQARVSMRKIREILRLTANGLSARQVAASIGVARSTVGECLRRAAEAEVSWPLQEGVDETALERRLYPPPPRRDGAPPSPDCAALHAELRRKGVTLWLLWQEYKSAHPDGYQYSRFCDLYRVWAHTQDAVLRQTHTPGDKCFVDYAGPTVDVIDPHSGEVRKAAIFVGVLGYSNYTYAEATWTQNVADWLGSQVRMLEAFAGVPAAIVPDNLKSGVIRPHRYCPDLNPAYQDFAEHYAVTILPARVRKPRDKAKAEGAVLIVERFILARLRNLTFFSLAELNAVIGARVAELNSKPFQKQDGCRASWWATERKSLRPLPPAPYQYAHWKKAKVHLDYHVEVAHHCYSVPYALIGRTVDVRVAADTVEIFDHGHRVAAHVRCDVRGSFTTCPAHRPDQHRAVVECSQTRLLQRAEAIGPATVAILKCQSHTRKHPEHTLRTCLGILRLAKDFSASDLEAACQRALTLKTYSYRAIRGLILNPAVTDLALSLPAHDNLRGPSYYH